MSSLWQQRYGLEDDASLSNWIEEVQRKADENDYIEIDGYNAPTDADIADVIARMEQILNTTVEQHNVSFNFDDYLELSSNDSSSQMNFDDHIVASIRMQSNDRMKKRCFDELVRHCKSEKKRLGWIEKLITKQQRLKMLSKYLLTWKSINRMIRVKEAMLACKIGRATSNKFRRVFVEWKRLMLARREQLSKADNRFRRKVCRRTISVMIQNKSLSLLNMERARDRFECIRKAKILSSWRVLVREQRELQNKLVIKAETHLKCRVMRQLFAAWSSSCPRETNSPNPKPNDTEKVDTNANQRTTTNNDDELLRPLRKSRRRSSRVASASNVVTNAQQRNEERLRRREVLRSLKEKAAVERTKLLHAERLSREERELRIHTENLHRKKMEKDKKEFEIARYKEANRLAVLHYKFSLQKRYLLQWKRIFGIKGWNERKANLLLRDTLYEKYFSCWCMFARNKNLRLAKRQHLAADFYETSLLAKGLASLEENVKHSLHTYDKAVSRISMLRKRTVLKEWRRKSLLHVKEREAKEIEARRVRRKCILQQALRAWKVGVNMSREEKRMERLVDEKYSAMMKWLDASRNDNDQY